MDEFNPSSGSTTTTDVINTEPNEVSVDIDEGAVLLKQLASSIEAKIHPMPSSKCCIYRVSKNIRNGKEDTFAPQILSIGPFHHGKPSLQAMEEHKKWYLHAFRSRTKMNVEDLIRSIWNLELDARDCYAEPIDRLSDNHKFVEMLLLDGCFILELMYRYKEKGKDAEATYNNDRIFKSTYMFGRVLQDLMLLENQLPFIVLEALFNHTIHPDRKPGCTIMELVAYFFDPIFPTVEKLKLNPNTEVKHLLDFIRTHLFPWSEKSEWGDHPTWEYTKCVTNLSEAGVKFKKKSKAKGLLDIRFSKEGVLEIPPFLIGSSMTSLLSNLVVLEQYQGYESNVTSYVILLDSLISSPSDVKLLRDQEIIDCFFFEDEAVADFINKLCKFAQVKEFHYDGLCNRINKYYRSYWPRTLATLKRDYFNNPWAIISFVAAIVLLLLTFIQALVSILAYPNSCIPHIPLIIFKFMASVIKFQCICSIN